MSPVECFFTRTKSSLLNGCEEIKGALCIVYTYKLFPNGLIRNLNLYKLKAGDRYLSSLWVHHTDSWVCICWFWLVVLFNGCFLWGSERLSEPNQQIIENVRTFLMKALLKKIKKPSEFCPCLKSSLFLVSSTFSSLVTCGLLLG